VQNLSIVIPAFNEENNIEELVLEVLSEIGNLAGYHVELILVNDGSTDSTLERMQGLAKNHSNIRIAGHPTRRGLGAALWTGFAKTQDGLCTWLPADGQIQLKSVLSMLPLVKDCDIAMLDRSMANRGFLRKTVSICMSVWAKLVIGVSLKSYCGIFLCKTEILRQVDLITNSFAQTFIIPALTHKKYFTSAQITTNFLPRRSGHSKVANMRTLLRVMADMIKIRHYIQTKKMRPQ